METLTVEIKKPKAKKLLKEMEAQQLIGIRNNTKDEIAFRKVLARLRSKSEQALSPEELAKEVKAVRRKRYEK